MSAASQSARTPPEPASLARRLGQVAQGLLVGGLLMLALFELVSQAGAIMPFKYQGF